MKGVFMKYIFLASFLIWFNKLSSQSFIFPPVTTPPGCSPPDNYVLRCSMSISKVVVTDIYYDNGVIGSFAYNVFVDINTSFEGTIASPGNFYSYSIILESANPNATSPLTNNFSNVPLTSTYQTDIPVGTNPTFQGSASSLGLALNGTYSSPDILRKLGYNTATLYIDASCIGEHTLKAGGIILPVRFSPLKARNNRNHVELEWSTFTETNNAGFYVERSSDGSHWYQIAWLPGSVNNTTAKTNYSYTDNSPFPGINVYRLKQKDIDGNTTYSNTVAVKIEDTPTKNIIIEPNPARSTITLTTFYPGSFNYCLYNMAGQSVRKGNSRGNKNVLLQVDNLPEGLYILKTDEEVHKLIIKH